MYDHKIERDKQIRARAKDTNFNENRQANKIEKV